MSKRIDIPPASSSKRHRDLYDIFCASPLFSNMVIKQEVAISDLVPSYKNRRHKIDWFIKDLNICIELHGKQHAQPTRWGNISQTQAELNFVESKKRDRQKEQALVRSGYTYVCIWYDEDLTEASLIKKIEEAAVNAD